MPTAIINGINIYYEISGSGEPLIFVPGLGGATDLWHYQTKYFQNHYLTISLDNRGAGRSDKPEEDYSMAQFAGDLNGLLKFLDVREPVNLVGASMGGIIAQAFIHDYPERVKRLVLACSGVSSGDPHYSPPSPQVIGKLMNPGATIEEKLETFLQIFYHPDFVARNPGIRELYLRRKIEPQPLHAYLSQLKACADPRPYYEWLAEIRVPVLVMHGSDDLVWPLQNARTVMHRLGSHGELGLIEKAGHIFMQEKPEEFNRVLHAFLSRQPG